MKAKQRRFGQIKSLFAIGFGVFCQFLLLLVFGQMAPVVLNEIDGHIAGNHLQHLVHFFPDKGSAQGTVAIDDGLPCLLKGLHIKMTVQFNRKLFKISGRFGIVHVMEQHALLQG